MEIQVCSSVNLSAGEQYEYNLIAVSMSNIQQSSWTGGSARWRPCAPPKVGRYLPADRHNIKENFDINFNVTLSSMFRSTKWSLIFRFSDQQPVWNFLLSHACHTSSPRYIHVYLYIYIYIYICNMCVCVCVCVCEWVFLQVEWVVRVLLGNLMIYWKMGFFETASALRSGVFTENFIVCLSHYLWR